MTEEKNERLAVLETISARNEHDVQRVRADQEAFREASNSTFGDIKEGLIHLRVGAEAMARTQEAIVTQLSDVHMRVGALEVGLNQHKDQVTSSLEKIDSGWKSEKNRLLAYCSGAVMVISTLWAVLGGFIKSFFAGLIS